MAIKRAPRNGHFTTIPNATLRDREMSFRARGVLAFILSMPDHWSTTSEALAKEGPEGRDAVRKCLREIEDAGYMVRQRTQDPVTGQWSTDVMVYDEPTVAPDEDPVDDAADPTTDSQSSVPPAETPESPGRPEDWKTERRWARPHREKTNYEDQKSTGRPQGGERRPRPPAYVAEGAPSAT